MQIYVSKYTGPSGGGLILVAAHSATEALQVALRKSEYKYLFDKEDPTMYNMSEFEPVIGATSDLGVPSVVCESVYIE